MTMALSDFTIIVPSMINVSIAHIDHLASCLDIEAIVCIPRLIQGPLQFSPHISFVRSSKAGQVFQRLHAISCAKTRYVIVMDDDIFLPISDCSSVIHKYLNLASSIGPSVLGVHITCQSLVTSSQNILSCRALSLLSLIEGTSQTLLTSPSTLSPLLFNTPHDPSFVDCYTRDFGCYRSDWISGGFFLAPVSLFPVTNYYPYAGKAFSEDIILSSLFTARGASLFIANGVYATTDIINPSFSFSNLRSKIYLLRFSNVSLRFPRFILSLLVRRLSLMSWF